MVSKTPARTPRYVEIATDLREHIASRKLGPHALVPSERELGGRYGVSRMTARQAVALLESEGYVYRRPPRGTFVAEPRVQFHIGSFSDEVRRLGRVPSARLLWADEVGATGSVAEALELAEDEPVHAVHRLRLMDDEPLALETTYYAAAVTPGLLDSPPEGSLWEVLRTRYGLQLARSNAVVESIVIGEAASAKLAVRSASPGILLTRRTFDDHGRCVEFARDVYRADRASFDVTEDL